MLIDSGKVIYTWSQEPPVITTKVELKKNEGREAFKNLITQGWRSIKEDYKKENRAANT